MANEDAEMVYYTSGNDDPLSQLPTLGMWGPDSSTRKEWIEFLEAKGYKIVEHPGGAVNE